jgi:hypothetical protein
MMRKVIKIDANGDRIISAKLRTAAYCRVSTDSGDQLLSLEAQKRHYEKVIKDNPEWEFAGLYCDVGTPYGLNTKAHKCLILQESIGAFLLEKIPSGRKADVTWTWMTISHGVIAR